MMDRKALALIDNILHAAFALLFVLDVALVGYILLERWAP